MQIPEEIVGHLTCVKCSDYLSSPPVSMLEDGRNVCGRCSATLRCSRNAAYETVAQMLVFPCSYRTFGCTEPVRWNSDHEARCEFRPCVIDRASMLIDNCVFCKLNISIRPRYECFNGHEMCVRCSRTQKQCPVCSEAIDWSPRYICKNWKYNCRFKAGRDDAKRHEADCPNNQYHCPFVDVGCTWCGTTYELKKHVSTDHASQVFQNGERTAQLRDQRWVTLAEGAVFKCYLRCDKTEVALLAKLIGPQNDSSNYNYEVKILQPNQRDKEHPAAELKIARVCQGWNSFALDNCASFPIGRLRNYLLNGTLKYSFTITKRSGVVDDDGDNNASA